MDSLLPSETARLILGYLEEECETAAQNFLEKCSYLQECFLMAQQGKSYSTRPYNQSLKQILEEYCAIRKLVSDRLKKLPESSAASLSQCSVVEQLNHLMGLSRSGQTLLVSITMPPQGNGSGVSQDLTTPPHSQGRARSRQSNSAERCKKLSVRWQGSETQQPSQEIEHVTSVEATPANSLPGLSNEDVQVESHPNQAPEGNEGPNCPHLDNSDDIAPIGSGSCTSTPKRKMSSKRKGTPSTKGSPSVKAVSPSVRLRRSLSEEEPNESINLTFLTQAFLENKELHQKIAENINKVIGLEQHVPLSAQQPVETSCGPVGPAGEITQEMDSVIKTIVDQTEQDPLFERFLEDLIGPVEPMMDDKPGLEAEDREESSPLFLTRPETNDSSTMPQTNEVDIPLKQRLRNARPKKDSSHAETSQKEQPHTQELDEKTKSSLHCATITAESGRSDCAVSLEHQNAAAVESIVNANVFPSTSKQSPPILSFNMTLGHIVSGDVPDTSHDHNSIMSASCIDRLTKEVASLQGDKYQFLDGNVSLPSLCGSFSLGSDTIKTAGGMKSVTMQSTVKSSSGLLQKPLCGTEVTDAILVNDMQTVSSKFSKEASAESRSTHCASHQGTNITNLIFSDNVSHGAKIADNPDQVSSTTFLKDSCKGVYDVVCIASQPNTENVHCSFPSSFSPSASHTSVCSGSKVGYASAVSVVSGGNQQPLCSVQAKSGSLDKHYSCVDKNDGNKIHFSDCGSIAHPGVGNTSPDLTTSGLADRDRNVCGTLGNYPSCSNMGVPANFYAEGGGNVATRVKPIRSGNSLQGHAANMNQVLSVNISEGDGSVMTQQSAGQVQYINISEGEFSQPLTESQLMQMPLILCGSEKNMQLINILKPTTRPHAPVVPVVSRKKGYIPILPKKNTKAHDNKLTIIPSSTPMIQENVGQQFVMVPSATDGHSVAMFSYSALEEPVHFSDSNPCVQSLPTICIESPVIKVTEEREQLHGALNLLESNNKDSANTAEHSVSPQFMSLVDLGRNTVSPTKEAVAASETCPSETNPSATNPSAADNNITQDTSSHEMQPRNTPTISSASKQKGSNSRRLSLSTPRRKRSHVRTLEFNTPLKPTSVRKSNTSPKVSGKVPRPTSSSTLPKSVRRMSLFKSPVNKTSVQNTTTENNVDLVRAENSQDIVCPIATRSPAPVLSGSWDKVTGAGLIIPDSSCREEIESQTNTVDVEEGLEETSGTSRQQVNKKKLTPTWDSALRALLSPSYSDPEPPLKILQSKNKKKCTKKSILEEARRIETELCKSSEKEFPNVSFCESAVNMDVKTKKNPGIITKRLLEQESKQSVKKRKDGKQTPAKQKTNSSFKRLNQRVKTKLPSKKSCGICHTPSKSSLKSSTKSSLKSNVDTPLKGKGRVLVKSSAKTPVKKNSKSPLKNKATTPLPGKARALTKSKKNVQRQTRQKVKVKLPTKILKVNVEKLAEVHNSVGVDGTNNYNDTDNENALLSNSNHVAENTCNTDVVDVISSNSGNLKLSDNVEADGGIVHKNTTSQEKNKSFTRKLRKNPSPSKNIYKRTEKEKDSIAHDSEKKLSFRAECTIESTTSKVVQSPTNLKAAKRTLVRKQLMAGRKLDLFEDCSDVNSEVTEPVPSCSQAIVLDTPEKTDTGVDVSLVIPMTPRVVSPKLVEDTPITKLIKEQIATYDDTIMTPNFPCTPNIPVTPRSLEAGLVNEASPEEYPSRPTDYSSCSSYYQPSDDQSNQHKSLEQVLIDECRRMEANKVADEQEKTTMTMSNTMHTNVSVQDVKKSSSCKSSEVEMETTVQPTECLSDTVCEALPQNDPLCERNTDGDLTTKEKCIIISHIEKAAACIREMEHTDKVVCQSVTEVQVHKVCSQQKGHSETVKQGKPNTKQITILEESSRVGEQEDKIVDQMEKSEISSQADVTTRTMELISRPPFTVKTGVMCQQETSSVSQSTLIEEDSAVTIQNSDNSQCFVIEKENSIGDDSRDVGQSKDKRTSSVHDNSLVCEVNINSSGDMHTDQMEEEYVHSVVAVSSTSSNFHIKSSHASEEVSGSVQQSCDKTNAAVGKCRKNLNVPDECSKQAESLLSNSKETADSCARTSVFNFTDKSSKSDSENDCYNKKVKSIYGGNNARKTLNSSFSSSEESVSSEENLKLTNVIKTDIGKNEEPCATKLQNVSNESDFISSDLFGNYSDESSDEESINNECNKDKKVVGVSDKDNLEHKTLEEHNSVETNIIKDTSQQPVSKVILDEVKTITSKTLVHNHALSQNLALSDGKLWLELEEKRLRTLAKLKEPPKFKGRSNATEFSSKYCKEKHSKGISKTAVRENKPSAREGTETLTKEMVKKSNRLRKQGVNAIAERLREQQQAVADSVPKLIRSQEELPCAERCLSNSDVELQLAHMYGELEASAEDDGVQNTGKTEVNQSNKISPAKSLEDILSSTVEYSKETNPRKRRFSSIDGHTSRKKNSEHTTAKFPKLSLKDFSVSNCTKQNVFKETVKINKPMSFDELICKIDHSEKLKKSFVQKEKCCKNLSGVRNVSSDSRELAEINSTPPNTDATFQKCVDVEERTREKEARCSTDVLLNQNTAVGGVHPDLKILPRNTRNSESHCIESNVSDVSCLSKIDVPQVGSISSKVQTLESDNSSSKTLNKNSLSSRSCRLGGGKVPSKLRNPKLDRTHSLPSKSNEKGRAMTSSNTSSIKTKIKRKVVKKEKRVLKSLDKLSKDEFDKETNTSMEKSSSVVHSSKQKNSLLEVCDTNQCTKMTALQSISRNGISNVNQKMSFNEKNEVCSELRPKANISPLRDHENRVMTKPQILVKENSSQVQHCSKEIRIENSVVINSSSQSKEESSEFPTTSIDNAVEQTSSLSFLEKKLDNSMNKAKVTDELIISPKSNLLIAQEIYPSDTEGLSANESILISEVKESSQVQPAQDNVKSLIQESMSLEQSVDTEVPVIEEDYISHSERLVYISYKSNGPHIEHEPSSIDWSDCAVKLLVDDFEITCSVTPLVELLDLVPAVQDELCLEESTSDNKGRENERVAVNKFHSENGKPDGHKIISNKSALKVPKKVNVNVSENCLDMVSPLTLLYSDMKKNLSRNDLQIELDRLGTENKKEKQIELDRLGPENEKEKCKPKNDVIHYQRRSNYLSSLERHKSRLTLKERLHYPSSRSRTMFYRRSSERQMFQNSGSHHEKSTKPSDSKHLEEIREERYKVKYNRYVSRSRSKNMEKPYFYTNRREYLMEDCDLRGKDCSHMKSSRQYMSEALDDGMKKRSESKYSRHKGREEHSFHKNAKGDFLEERRRIRFKNTQHPNTEIDESEEKNRSRYEHSSYNRTSVYGHKKSRDKLHEKEVRINYLAENMKQSMLESRIEGTKAMTKLQTSKINLETNIHDTSSLPKMSKDSLIDESSIEDSHVLKSSKRSSASVRKKGENTKLNVDVNDDTEKQFHSEVISKDISESAEVSDDFDEYVCNSGLEQEMRSFPLAKSPVEQICDDELMMYAVLGSPSRTQQSFSSESKCRSAVDEESKNRETNLVSVNIGKEDIRTLPPKKRKASSEEMSSHVGKKECMETADPQTLLNKVGLENFLSVLHGETT